MSIATENCAITGQHEMAFINEQHRIQQRLYSKFLFTVTFMRHTDELAPYHPLHCDLQYILSSNPLANASAMIWGILAKGSLFFAAILMGR